MSKRETLTAEVVIVGAGAVGGLMATRLAAAGMKVVVLDAGARVDRATAVQRFRDHPWGGTNSPYPDAAWAPVPDEDKAGVFYGQDIPAGTPPTEQLEFKGLYLRQVGGSSWHFTAHAERFYPADFEMKTRYGRGVDWPIGYKALEPWYAEAEKEWGVAGNAHCLGPERTTGFPMPAVPMSYLDLTVAKAVHALGKDKEWPVGPYPHARNSVPGYDGRPQCCGNSSCRYICPINAKYDGSVHVAKAEKLGAWVMPERVACDVVIGNSGRVEKIRYLRRDGAEGEAIGKLFIIAAHAIESAKLLLMSNVANSSGAVGRYLTASIDMSSRGYATDPVWPFRGPVSATGGVGGLRDGDFRKQHSAVATFIINGGFDGTLRGPTGEVAAALNDGLIGEDLRKRVHDRAARQVRLVSSMEVLPIEGNRVTVDPTRRDALGLPYPKVDFRIDQSTLDGCRVAVERDVQILQAMKASDIRKADWQKPEVGNAMIAGTTRMGEDARTSVVDADCRSHDHDNLYVVGTSVYPTITICSPTLTAAALALRTADAIIKRGLPL